MKINPANFEMALARQGKPRREIIKAAKKSPDWWDQVRYRVLHGRNFRSCTVGMVARAIGCAVEDIVDERTE